jgi:AAA family ATP:ADP antiporter
MQFPTKKLLEKKKRNQHEYTKLVSLSCAFFFIIGTYSILRPLKVSIFLGMVGKEYQPIIQIISMLVLIPCVLLYAKLVDKVKRHQVFYCFLAIYIIGLLLAALFLNHPVFGLQNTQTSMYRTIGWLFYLFSDLFSPLVITTFWAFANSISTTESAKNSYGKIVAFSRFGGIGASFFSWYVMQYTTISHHISIPFLLIGCSVMLLLCLLSIANIIKKVPTQFLHSVVTNQSLFKPHQKGHNKKTGVLQGLKLLITQPYIFGIFILVYIFDAISIITDYQMQVLMAVKNNNGIQQMSAFMFLYTVAFHALTLFFALVGTSALLKKIGVRFCILVMPVATIALMITLICNPTLHTIFIIMVVFRALHYGFNAPVREILYIPTTKDIKFKSKAWIDSFGRSFSKSSGSALNLLSQARNITRLIRIDAICAISLSTVWIVIAFLVGKKYQKTIKKKQIIG